MANSHGFLTNDSYIFDIESKKSFHKTAISSYFSLLLDLEPIILLPLQRKLKKTVRKSVQIKGFSDTT